MSEFCEIEAAGPDSFILRGEFSFATVAELSRKSAQILWENDNITLDLDGVSRTDSAGLALLVEWVRIARRKNKTIQFCNMPEQMTAIAQVVGLDGLLPIK